MLIRESDRVAAGRRAVPAGVLAVLLTATFMAQFDFFVVNVAAPSIRGDLHASESALELVVGGYAFAYAAALVLGGRLGDLFGRRRVFVLGMVGFTVTSALCGIAANPGELIGARLAQGLTAALMLPQVLAVISASSDATERPRALAWYGVAAGLGSIAGQVFGGLLVTADVAGLGWRLIFLVNVPIGGIGAVLARFLATAFAHLDPDREVGIRVTNIIGEGDQVVVEWHCWATGKAGRPYDQKNIAVFTVRRGKIASMREYADTQHWERALVGDEARS